MFRKHWLTAGIVACLAVTLLGFAGHWHWYPDLYNHLRPQYVVALTVALVFGLCLQRWRSVLACMAGLGLNAAAMVSHAWQPAAAETVVTAPATLEVATINLLRRNRNHGELEQLLRQRQPDVVVFQEVADHWAPVLQGLKDIYPQQRMEYNRKGFWGLAILSRVPWKNADLIRLATGATKIGMVTEFEFQGRTVSLLNVHASHPTSEGEIQQRNQVHDAISKWSEEKRLAGNSVVVAGDFNCTPWAVLFQRFIADSGLIDTSRGRVFEATRHVALPDRIMIDHVFVSPDWELVGREVGPDFGSDHRPVFVSLGVPQSSATPAVAVVK
ncbi:MAG TPA: endonuclease/exonuclease/phosphatase family protein [Verrucomicrobium sp.]|nr:endonuclease/exonuclease/phosphatase family protein [Verrucomicrobium sp.]